MNRPRRSSGLISCLIIVRRLSTQTAGENGGKLRKGWVAEWFKAAVLKTAVGSRPPWVRIPPHPPEHQQNWHLQRQGPLVPIKATKNVRFLCGPARVADHLRRRANLRRNHSS